MENISGTMEKDLISPKTGSAKARNRNWQLLFVDDHGKMISFPWLKSAVLALGATLAFFMVSTGVLFFLYQTHRSENRILHEKQAEAERQIKDLRNEMDIMLARLVLAESKTKPASAEVEKENHKPSVVKKVMAKAAPTKETKQDLHPAPEKKIVEKKVVEKRIQQEKVKPPPPRQLGLEITNFSITQESVVPGILKISFKIKNADKKVKTASGYIFIIVKPDVSNPATWFSVPSAQLQDGYPADARKGQYFRISRFKTVYFRANTQIRLEDLNIATVYVFNKSNQRLFAKDFPVQPPEKKKTEKPVFPGKTEKLEKQKQDTADTREKPAKIRKAAPPELGSDGSQASDEKNTQKKQVKNE